MIHSVVMFSTRNSLQDASEVALLMQFQPPLSLLHIPFPCAPFVRNIWLPFGALIVCTAFHHKQTKECESPIEWTTGKHVTTSLEFHYQICNFRTEAAANPPVNKALIDAHSTEEGWRQKVISCFCHLLVPIWSLFVHNILEKGSRSLEMSTS